MFDLGTLQIQKLIVHEVPRRFPGGAGNEPILSEVESDLTTGLRNYFTEKIKESLLRAPFEVVFRDPGLPVPALVLDQLSAQTQTFVAASQKMATHLFDSQTGVNTGGLLVVMGGKVVKKPCLGILKLEREEGIRAQQHEVSGLRTFNLQHLQDLFLSKKTRVFKVGVFGWLGSSVKEMEAHVSDNQRGYVPRTEVADFFLRKYLGCELKESPDVVTSRFLESTQSFINESVSDASTKARYSIALAAELTSQGVTISPFDFANQHMDLNDRQPYVQHIQEAGIPEQVFDKDTTLVASRLKRLQFDFESGISLLAAPEVIDSHVKMDAKADGETTVSFTDRVKDVHPKR